ncbi:Oidioi.mRNA.OKI2018_I69.chr1.g181.t1.cds [Oikopleura dioica]|uniref:Oidioi.mRNA.OKI2018_I69.chr1.g181.t1.cds n=1 Tax=Oikopleura dioica TaxID=34765 RepID=A0ABN7SMW2_OIKDI|nr:Oidioi.mRNA.OKI2018_I69.chr1.g181.t1.cds [Oikopleura dioica]
MKKRQAAKRNIREIRSDDEVSDSDVVNETDKFHENIDHDSEIEDDSENEEFEVGKVRGRDDSDEEDDYDFEEEAESSEDDGPALPSRDDFGERPDSYYADSAQPKKKKQKRETKAEAAERLKDEREDAEFRLDDAHNFLEDVGDTLLDDDEEEEKPEDVPEKALAEMDISEKMKLLKRQSPLLFPLIADFKHFEKEFTETLLPLQKFLGAEADEAFSDYLVKRIKLIRCYLLNISFYLRLRAKATPNLDQHPVVERLAQLRQIIDKSSSDKAQDYARAYLEAVTAENKIKKIGKVKKIEERKEESEESAGEEEDEEDNEMDEMNEEEADADGKRKVNRKIEKNVGLQKARQKKRRNPRVKHRMAYEDAKKRRKGAVRAVITDQKKKYTGEASGIRVGIKKSVRIKS